ncbi:MAG: hypothetical protein QME96_12050 [Myxococcota bacterium]|nr:hypothetical protein [Myxococcota bacterium]
MPAVGGRSPGTGPGLRQSAAAGLNLRVVVRVELAPTAEVPEDQLQKVTGVLDDVSKKLTLA